MALSDYRANANPTPGAQASNKPLLVALDAALASLLTQLANLGLITNETSA